MRNGPDFSVILPLSLTADAQDLREKTAKIGQVGRALSIFRASRVFIFDDRDSNVDNKEKELNILLTLLKYVETPQYLRKDLFPFMKELRYAGLLPPLRTPHHPLQDERNSKGDIREAAVQEVTKGRSYLNIGLPERGVFDGVMTEKERVTVRLGEKLSDRERMVYPVNEEGIDDYWGYEVFKSEDISQILSNESGDYCIGTSRYGQNLYEAVQRIKTDSTGDVTVAFGGPYQGLFEICDKQGLDVEDLFDIVVNTIPNQGTETVRAEEALLATLAVLNILYRRN